MYAVLRPYIYNFVNEPQSSTLLPEIDENQLNVLNESTHSTISFAFEQRHQVSGYQQSCRGDIIHDTYGYPGIVQGWRARPHFYSSQFFLVVQSPSELQTVSRLELCLLCPYFLLHTYTQWVLLTRWYAYRPCIRVPWCVHAVHIQTGQGGSVGAEWLFLGQTSPSTLSPCYEAANAILRLWRAEVWRTFKCSFEIFRLQCAFKLLC